MSRGSSSSKGRRRSEALPAGSVKELAQPIGPAARTPPELAIFVRADLAIALILALLASLLFLPNAANEFSSVDDNEYVTDNAAVKNGLTTAGVRWAFTSEHFYNWLPVTTLSHMLDVELYGLDAAGHHFTSILLHAANAALAYIALFLLTGRRWPSAAVALLFAVHPLRVESVAWLAERKDLLSATFFFLVLISYARYVRRPGIVRYLWVLVMLALGLMSKTILVTVPFLLLLLDGWPLRRMRFVADDDKHGFADDRRPKAPNTPGTREGSLSNQLSIGRLVIEKLPMMALVVAASLWTLSLQQGGGATELSAELTMGQRVANGVVSVWRYVGKLVLPTELSPFYTHPRSWAKIAVAVSAVLFFSATLVALRMTRRRPYLIVGWGWFLGMLFPVSGVLVHAGRQSIADRYLYLSGLGLLVVIVWAIAEGVRSRPSLRPAVAIALGVVVLALSAATVRYQAFWQNDLSLYGHALEVDPDNWFAHQVVGRQLRGEGRDDLAAEHFRRSLAIEPGNHRLRLEQASLLLTLSPATAGEAADEFRKVVQAAPNEPGAWVGLARAELAAGRTTEADLAFADAARRWPNDADIQAQWAIALVRQGRAEEARKKAEAALLLDPTNEVARIAMNRVAPSAGDH